MYNQYKKCSIFVSAKLEVLQPSKFNSMIAVGDIHISFILQLSDIQYEITSCMLSSISTMTTASLNTACALHIQTVKNYISDSSPSRKSPNLSNKGQGHIIYLPSSGYSSTKIRLIVIGSRTI